MLCKTLYQCIAWFIKLWKSSTLLIFEVNLVFRPFCVMLGKTSGTRCLVSLWPSPRIPPPRTPTNLYRNRNGETWLRMVYGFPALYSPYSLGSQSYILSRLLSHISSVPYTIIAATITTRKDKPGYCYWLKWRWARHRLRESRRDWGLSSL